jgi:hypothetical protein
VLASDGLSGVDTRVADLSNAKAVSGKCPLTSHTRLPDAIAAIFLSKAYSHAVTGLTVSRTSVIATISFKDRNGTVRSSEFKGARAKQDAIINVVAELDRAAFLKIADDVQAIVDEGFQSES